MMAALRLAVLAAAVDQCATLSGYVRIDGGLSYCNTNAGGGVVYETSASTMANCVALCGGRGSYVALGYAIDYSQECVCYTACDCLEWDGNHPMPGNVTTYFPANFSQPGYCDPTNNPNMCTSCSAPGCVCTTAVNSGTTNNPNKVAVNSGTTAASTATVAGFGVAALAVVATASILRLC
eukprot:COSAG01_NODE_2326_length_7903_cov_22.624552_5_plen_180_part_00